MADEELLEILRRGPEAWNKERADANRPLSGRWLSSDLSGANLRDANLTRTHLSYIDFNGAELTFANLNGADLTGARLVRAKLIGTDLGGATLIQANLNGADLGEADLGGTDFGQAQLIRANLTGADLNMADFCGANLSEANFTAASARFRWTNLSGTDLSKAELDRTVFLNVDLRNVKGLESVVHKGPSSIDFDTLYRSAAEIHEEFLRGCGVPDDFISYMRSLVGRPIEYYSCFITYSTKDQEFADRIYADLQSNGVRCWFAPEDMKIGDEIRRMIDTSLRMRDKVMVVLSAHSIASAWVQKEVEMAFEEEIRRNKQVLFPVRLDDHVMKTDVAWAADIRRMKNIGDFREWRTHDRYKKALERVLRDLKAGSETRIRTEERM